jgi:hypothetical protein
MMQKAQNQANLALAQAGLRWSGSGQLDRDEYLAARKKTALLYLRALAALLNSGVPVKPEPPGAAGQLPPSIWAGPVPEKVTEAYRKFDAEFQDAWKRYWVEDDIMGGRRNLSLNIEAMYEYPPYATEELRQMALATLKNQAEVDKMISAVQATIAETTKSGPQAERYSTEPAAGGPTSQAAVTLDAVRRLVDQSTDACLRYLDAAEPDRAAARRDYAALNLKSLAVILATVAPSVPKEDLKVPQPPTLSNPQNPTEADQAAQKKFYEDLAAWRQTYNRSLLGSELDGYHQSLVRVICDTYTMPPPATDELRQLATATLNNQAAVEDLVSAVNEKLAHEAAERGEAPPAAPPAPATAPAVPAAK